MQTPTPADVDDRLKVVLERHLPPGKVQEIQQTVDNQAAASGRTKDELKTEGLIFLAEARRLAPKNEPDGEEAKAMMRRWKAFTQGIDRPAPELRAAWLRGLEEAMADPALGPDLPVDAQALAFIKRVAEGMKARGELT